MNTTSRIAKIDNSAARLLSPIENFSGILEGSKTEKKIRQAAEGFERTLLRQLLSVARNTNISGLETKSATSMGYLQMMDDQIADLLAKTKKVGFGDKVAEKLLDQSNIKQLIINEKKAVNSKDELDSPVLNKYMRPNPLPFKN